VRAEILPLLLRLLTGAKDQIDNDVRRKSMDILLAFEKSIPTSMKLQDLAIARIDISSALQDRKFVPRID
jgi:hypothetical protein